MAEINNALAAQIQVPQVDLGSTLAKAAQINNLNANTARTNQETEHRSFLFKQGGGYDPSELQTLQGTREKMMENAGRIGSAYLTNPTDTAWSAAVDEAERAGLIRGSLEKAQYLSMPPQKRAGVAQALQQAGMSSSTATEQTGIPAANRAREEGRYVPQSIPPNTPIISRTEAATGGRSSAGNMPSSSKAWGSDEGVKAGLYEPTAEQRKRGIIGPDQADIGIQPGIKRNIDGSISSTVTPETEGTQRSLAEDYDEYKKSAKAAAVTKYVLHNMRDDADRLTTGKGATFSNTAKQWLQSAQNLPGVGDVVKKITGDVSDPVAAFEALQKNAGQLTRATLKDVDGKAASEYMMIQKQLPNVEMSARGIKLVTAQMMAPEDYKQAKLQAADNWKRAHQGSLGGFENTWNSNITPATFLFARLEPNERDTLVKNMSKTESGRAQLARIKQQATWAHQNGLDGLID